MSPSSLTKQAFNVLVAEKVMGWETLLQPLAMDPSGYCRWVPGSEGNRYFDGVDFLADHNAAALVRERVVELGVQENFMDRMADYFRPGWGKDVGGGEVIMALLTATPEQTARAAYFAVTGEELGEVQDA